MLDLYYCETTITEQTKWIENILPVVPQIRDIKLVRSLFFGWDTNSRSVLVFNQTASCFEIGSDHFFHEAVKRDFTLPTQMLFRLGGITQKEPGRRVSELLSIESMKNEEYTLYFGRTEVFRVNPDNGLAWLFVDGMFLFTMARPPSWDREDPWDKKRDSEEKISLEFHSYFLERFLCKLSHRMHFSCSEDKIARCRLLQHQPHSFYVIAGFEEEKFNLSIMRLKNKRSDMPWPQSRKASIFPRYRHPCFPNEISAAARVIFLVTKVLPRLGLSWLNSIPLQAYIP